MSTTNKLTPEMRAFLADLADLMERYDIEIDAFQETIAVASFPSDVTVINDYADLGEIVSGAGIRKFLETQP